MAKNSIIHDVTPLGFPWPTLDPFLFCAYHNDAYPAANERFGPAASLAGRTLGNDFEIKDGFRMYHGETVPGFPPHPHRGFETVTLVRRGLIDHSDSLGATARFGGGDAQWLTAGKGIMHSEMFPLLDAQGPNPVELFQIWLNLPAHDKMAEPHFTMFWNKAIPRQTFQDGQGRNTEVTLVAGPQFGLQPPAPPPHSWAAKPKSDLAIWTLRLDPGALWNLPAGGRDSNRTLYFFRGGSLRVGEREIQSGVAVALQSHAEALLQNGDQESELLLLQGKPIGEPVVQYGPFVMNSDEEIRQAFADYQKTKFGGWPWPSEEPVHARDNRFARYPDGKVERPE